MLKSHFKVIYSSVVLDIDLIYHFHVLELEEN